MVGKIKISIVIAVLNGEKTIEQMLESILDQTYDNIEIIIIDGCSTDSTCDILRKYDSKISYWISEEDSGLYDALNKGVMKTTGDYVEILGSDDCLSDRFVIENIVKNIDKSTDIISGTQWVIDEEYNKQFYNSNKFAINKGNYSGGMPPHGSMFVRKSLLLKYPFDVKYKIVSDYKFFLQCYYDKNVIIKYVDFPVTFFSLSGMSSNSENRMAEDKKMLMELMPPFFKEESLAGEIMIKAKKMVKKMGWFMMMKKMIYRYIILKPHNCNNKICRWCGRYK